jgi:hypothetical protein
MSLQKHVVVDMLIPKQSYVKISPKQCTMLNKTAVFTKILDGSIVNLYSE